MQITAIEKNNRKKKNMKKAAISATVIFAMMTCLSFAYATSIFEAVGDALFSGTLIQNPLDVIVSSFLLLVFKTIIQCVVNVLDIVISPINEITTMKMAELAQYLPFAEYKVQINEGEFAFDYTIASKVNDYIIGIGVLIWILLSCFAILIDFYYVASGDKRAIPGSKLFLSITITGVLTYKAQDLMFFLFDNEINPLISEFLDIAQKDQTGIFENMGNSVCASWQGVPGILIALVMVLMIGINYIKLALEMVQRYLIVAVICVLSPLAFATGSNQETIDISKKWFRMFWSQCVLLFLNVWCVYVVREGMMAIGDKKANQLLIWGLIVYGFIKVAQQLDDLLQNAGLSITRQTSGMLEDFLMMGKSMIGLASTAATAAASGFQFKQDSANLREGLANGTKTMDDYKRHIANTTANMARNPLALAMMAPQMAREYAAAKGAEAEYKQSVGDYLKMKSPDRSKATAPNLNSAAGRSQIKDALANSKDKKIADAAKNGEVTKAYTDSNGVIHASLQTRDKNGRANVINPDEVMAMPFENVLLFRQHAKVLKANKFGYNLHPMFKEFAVKNEKGELELEQMPIISLLPSRKKYAATEDRDAFSAGTNKVKTGADFLSVAASNQEIASTQSTERFRQQQKRTEIPSAADMMSSTVKTETNTAGKGTATQSKKKNKFGI